MISDDILEFPLSKEDCGVPGHLQQFHDRRYGRHDAQRHQPELLAELLV